MVASNRKAVRPVEPEEILDDLLGLDRDLRLERYWGERSIFYNPGRAAPLGVILASIKDHDGENDRSSGLDREGVYRFAFQLDRYEYERRFGPMPARAAKGGVVAIPGYDPARLNVLLPHPVYAWMGWVQILSPTAERLDPLRPLLADALARVTEKWRRRKGA